MSSRASVAVSGALKVRTSCTAVRHVCTFSSGLQCVPELLRAGEGRVGMHARTDGRHAGRASCQAPCTDAWLWVGRRHGDPHGGAHVALCAAC